MWMEDHTLRNPFSYQEASLVQKPNDLRQAEERGIKFDSYFKNSLKQFTRNAIGKFIHSLSRQFFWMAGWSLKPDVVERPRLGQYLTIRYVKYLLSMCPPI